MGLRKVVLHYHIFKNAGTSIDLMLRHAFPSFTEWGEGVATGLWPEDLARRLRIEPVDALSSHTLRPSLCAPDGFELFPIALIRDPLDRAFSAYAHERHCPINTLSCQIARAYDFAGYVKWCLDHPSAGGVVICDYQTSHLGGATWRGHLYNARAGQGELGRAKRWIDTLPIVGVVDRFDAFAWALSGALENWWGCELAMMMTAWENRSPGRPTGLGARVAELEGLLGEKLLDEFRAANRYDAELYRHACERAA